MIKLPYGIADFHTLITNEYYYVDRTSLIPAIEDMGRTLIFLRPRRFGKSLWLSTLENYYDVRKGPEFDTLFGHLAIGKNPTPYHNQYLILRWNFSVPDPHGDIHDIKTSVYNHLNTMAYIFSERYADWLPHPIEIHDTDGIATFHRLLGTVQKTPYKLYLLIDEYDNFANSVLMSSHYDSQHRYESLIAGEGFMKTLFKAVKMALEGWGLDRVFITGVSPMVVNDMTSGFNISKDMSLNPKFTDLCGFREDEVATLLHAIAQTMNLTEEHTQDTMDTMQTFYNGYQFLPHQQNRLYNPTLTLYFLDHLQDIGDYPTEILDKNLATDSDKLTYIARQSFGKEIIARAINPDHPLAISQFSSQFGVNDILHGPKTDQFLITLLYYFGIITFTGQYNDRAESILEVPNLVTKQLYLNQIRELILTTALLRNQAAEIVQQFYAKGTIESLCTFVQQHYFSCMENRDYKWMNELSVKMMFLSLLQNDFYYSTFSEKPTQRGVADLVLLLKPDQRFHPLLDFLFEFKYLSLKKLAMKGEDLAALSPAEAEALPLAQKAFAKAEKALHRYRDALYRQYGDSLRLRCYVVVALGYEWVLWREIQET